MNIRCIRSVELWLFPGCALLMLATGAPSYFKYKAEQAAAACVYQVKTIAGIPYHAVDERNEILGHFERQPDGNIWLIKQDASVQDARRCLLQKGFTSRQLSMIATH